MTVKWTKREVRTMTGILDSFVVCNRPLSYAPGRDEAFRKWLGEALAEHRRDVVLGGLRGHLKTATERSWENAKTAQHYLANPSLCSQKPRDMIDGRPEIVVRFERFAAEEVKAAAWLEKLLARLATSDLPPEVAEYNPLEAARIRR